MNTMTQTIYTPAVSVTDAAKTSAVRVIEFPSTLFRTLVEWQRRYEERRQMKAITDSQLRDMGLTRSQVAAAAKPFWMA